MFKRIKLALILLLYGIMFCSTVFAQSTWIKDLDPFTPSIPTNHNYYERNLLVLHDRYVINGYYEDYYNCFAYYIHCDLYGNIISSEIEDWDTGANALTISASAGTLHSGWYRFSDITFLIKRDQQGNVQWYNSNAGNRIYTMDETLDGNIIMGGRTAWYNLAISKWDNDGNQQWSRVFMLDNFFEGNILSIKSYSDGGYVMTGWVSNYGYRDAFILKTDYLGSTEWYHILDGFGFDDRGMVVEETVDHNIIVSGENYTSIANEKGLLWLLDPQGNTLQQELGVFDDGVKAIVPLEDGNFIGANPYLIKLDEDFSLIWQKDYTISGQDKNIGLTSDGGFIFLQPSDDCLRLTKTDCDGNTDPLYVEEPEISASNILLYSPNPFSHSIRFSFDLKSNHQAELSIYNVKGQKVTSLCNQVLENGKKSFSWDATDTRNEVVCSGMYFAVLKVDGEVIETQKVTLIK